MGHRNPSTGGFVGPSRGRRPPPRCAQGGTRWRRGLRRSRGNNFRRRGAVGGARPAGAVPRMAGRPRCLPGVPARRCARCRQSFRRAGPVFPCPGIPPGVHHDDAPMAPWTPNRVDSRSSILPPRPPHKRINVPTEPARVTDAPRRTPRQSGAHRTRTDLARVFPKTVDRRQNDQRPAAACLRNDQRHVVEQVVKLV